MKKTANLIRWIGVTIFAIMAVYALSEGRFLGALSFLLGGAIITPLDIITKLRRKLKLNKTLSIVFAIVLLFAGALTTPTSEVPIDDNSSSQITGTISDDTSDTDKTTDNTTGDNSATASTTEDTSSKEDATSKPTTSTKPEESTSKPIISAVGTGKGETLNLSNIPAYSGKAYVTVNNNIPNFSATELKTTGYETYSNLDSLGRTRTAIASVGKDTMPKANEERGSISSINPTGWEQAKYDCVSGGWLYNRCHLIGWQLSAENTNKKNLITGTKYLNINGMLPFENMVADYIKETENHVAYRITPIYQGNNLLASGIQMEAYSVEDNGAGICFNVYCYNVQPNITINYADGSNSGPSSSNVSKEESSSTPTTTIKPDESTSTENTQQDTSSQTVYITATGKKYHLTRNCSGLSNAKAIYDSTLSAAKNKGLEPCSKCH